MNEWIKYLYFNTKIKYNTEISKQYRNLQARIFHSKEELYEANS